MAIYIYNGSGTSATDATILKFMFSMALHDHGIPVKFITHDDLNNPAQHWRKDAEVLVVGGGEFTPMKNKLTAIGWQAITNFAAEKTYLGICKGGYAGASQTEFFGQNGTKTSNGFGFFNGIARGSLPIAPSLYTGKSDSAQIATFYHEKYGIEFPALYWGGPYFDIAEGSLQNVEKLVTLKSDHFDTPKIMGVRMRVGEQGQAILLGYHAEALPFHIRSWVLEFCKNESDIHRIEKEMAQFDAWKFYIGFACILDDINLVKNHSFLNQILKCSKIQQEPDYAFLPTFPQPV
jgi:glutamine amidotransferase-like uncharacterized protein